MTAVERHIVIDGRIRRTGTGRPAERLIAHLPELDPVNRYTVLVEPDDPWRPSAAKWSAVPCPFPNFALNPVQQARFALFLYRLEPDLVHFTLTGQQPLLYFGRQVTFTHDLTMFKFVRTYGLPRWLHVLRMAGYRALVWRGHRRARRILVPTDYVRADVARFHPSTRPRLVTTYEAADPPIADEAMEPSYGEGRFVLYVGSAFPHKNLERLVGAFERLRQRAPDVRLVLVGERDPYWDELAALVRGRPSIAGAVVFGGFAPEPELKWLYQHADALVMPSLTEGFGLPGLEAMAHGCAVVSSSAACLPEVYGDAAHYFDPTDEVDMAAKLEQVVTEPERRAELIRRGGEQVKRFSWVRMAEQTHAIHTELLGGP